MKHTLESYLKKFVHETMSLDIRSSDRSVLMTVNSQVNRGIGLTENQSSMIREKLKKYSEVIDRLGLTSTMIDSAPVELPLRKVDKTKSISVVNNYIEIKFPFNKKLIKAVKTLQEKYYIFYSKDNEKKIHKFRVYEPIIYDVIEEFKDKNFEISQELLEAHREIKHILENRNDFIPIVTGTGVRNVKDEIIELIEKDIGEFNPANKIKYWDRYLRYGYCKETCLFENSSPLAQEIANRNSINYLANPEIYSNSDIVKAIDELDRYPLLVILKKGKEYEELKLYYEHFTNVPASEQILLNRVQSRNKFDNNVNLKANTFIKEKKFSVWLDKNIKIVYIFENNLPKLLLSNEWKPSACLYTTTSFGRSDTYNYIESHCDLCIETVPQFSHRYRRSRNLYNWEPN